MSKISRRTILGAAAAVAAAPIGATALVEATHPGPEGQPDPIYAALQEQRERWLAHGDAIDAEEAACVSYGDGSPEAKTAGRQTSLACRADSKGREAILSVVPTTTAGMLAYLSFVESPEGFGDDRLEDNDLAAMIETVRQFVAASSGGT